ncbi:MAG: hypothetical protein Q9162_002580 [Coniocarpon cinnabarinum]
MSNAQPGSTPNPARKSKSFAEVAAAANKPVIPQVKTPNNTAKPNDSPKSVVENGKASSNAASGAHLSSQAPSHSLQAGQVPPSLSRMMRETSINDRSGPSSSVENVIRRDNSDTKSVTSRTTLTLDEKESLMPDDSASMQGGRDEEPTSPAEDIHAGFKVDVDSDARAFQDQLYEIDRHGGKPLAIAQRPVTSSSIPARQNGAVAYQSPGVALQSPQGPSPREQSGGPGPGLVLHPDDKLIEALKSEKDRVFVVKIETDFRDFIEHSKDIELQLPSTNTFYRLLSHKLADYYILGHIYEDALKAVRIRKTAYTRLAPRLADLHPKSEGPTPPPTGSMKIMRRDPTGAIGPVLHSRPQSSSEGDAAVDTINDQAGSKQPLDKSAKTLEEREKHYHEVRARIFEDFHEKQAESGENSGNQSKEMSRSSSNSGAKRNKRGKRPKDDSFEARSSYTSVDGQAFVNNSFLPPQHQTPLMGSQAPYMQYPNMPMQFQAASPTFHMQQPLDLSAAGPWSGCGQYGHPGPAPPNVTGYSQWTPPQFDQSGGYYGSPSMGSQSTPKAQHPNLASYFPVNQQPQAEGSTWMQSGMQASMQNPVPQQNVFGMDSNANAYVVPYAYDMSMQPMPGYHAYSGQQFNPQSQAFVPGTPLGPLHGWTPQAQTSSGFSSPHAQQPGLAQNLSDGHSRGKAGNKNGQSQRPNGSIAKWANASSLPAKPPPTTSTLSFQMPRHMENGQPLPSKPLAANGRSP